MNMSELLTWGEFKSTSSNILNQYCNSSMQKISG